MNLQLYSVTDGYIDYLHTYHKHVYSNKEGNRTNDRKYLGVVFRVNGYSYFVPLSSAKPRDYLTDSSGQPILDVNGNPKIRPDTYLSFRIKTGKDGVYQIKGSIHFECMIPVPTSELELYDVDNEANQQYKDLVLEELEYIRRNSSKISKRAAAVYHRCAVLNDKSLIDRCLDFRDMERLCDTWVDNVKQ